MSKSKSKEPMHDPVVVINVRQGLDEALVVVEGGEEAMQDHPALFRLVKLSDIKAVSAEIRYVRPGEEGTPSNA